MRIAIGSDERTHLTDLVLTKLRYRGLEIEAYGALSNNHDTRWPLVARAVAKRVASRECHAGILFCWTGTGVSMAANKVPGVRAALCPDPETARGARAYNDANVLCLSLRLTSETVAQEILDQWLTTEVDSSESANIATLTEWDLRHGME